MNYLFIDIECADGNCAICEFEYVLTDENFNVIRKVNILIDPEHRFNLTNRKDHRDLILTYPESEYSKYYPFDDTYNTIKSLVTSKDTMVFGFSVANDINFLLKDSDRYKLKALEFDAYDVQKMQNFFDKEKKLGKNLESVTDELVPSDKLKDLKDHRGSDDAMKTMLVFKALVEKINIAPNELKELCENFKVNSIDVLEQNKRKKEEKEIYNKKKNMRKQGTELCQKMSEEHKALLNKPESKGKLVVMSGEMREHLDELKIVLSFIKDEGYIMLNQIGGSNFFIVFDEEDACKIKDTLKHEYLGEIITFKDFMRINN